MPRQQLYFWKQVPFIRLIIPLVAGILIQFYRPLQPVTLAISAVLSVIILIVYYLLSPALKYTKRWIPGVVVNLTLFIVGALLIFQHDIRNKKNWIGQYTKEKAMLLVTLQEPLVEKAKTYKAEASVETANINGEWKDVTGKVLVYFSKADLKELKYGTQVLLNKPLDEIKNSGNPGGFDYKQYEGFQNIFHQVFIKGNEYTISGNSNVSGFRNWLFGVRLWVVQKLQSYITPKREAGVAEALLIGYKDDLDKTLVQAYSNTGVVHIIAISGLHLGMIYLALVWLMKPFKRTKWIRFVQPVLILLIIWTFTMLAGGVPSILRSAVMFSFITIGQALNRKSSTYNTLASSAFVMLCINPYYLWDIGFQLSYAAVVSIITFSKPVYNWVYFQNKILDFFWELTSVTIAAQILTIPIIFYAFHQFPTYFLLTNILIVPLSSLILFAELLLLLTSYITPVATFLGLINGKLLALMNGFIEAVNHFPYSVYDGIQNGVMQTILLYLIIICLAHWLTKKTKYSLFYAIAGMAIFIVIDAIDNYQRRCQQKMIIYNIPQHAAIDFIVGKNYACRGDSSFQKDQYLTNFNLKPSRTYYGVLPANNLDNLFISYPFIQFASKRIAVIDKAYHFATSSKIAVDVIIISHNPRLHIADLAAVFDCKQYVFDASNSSWKIRQWKKDCDDLHLQNYSTSEKGAYQIDL